MSSSSTPDTGVLFVQLGTPDDPSPAAVRRYLAEFLADRRVVDLPRWFWLPLLHGQILRTRPRHSAELYQQIWRQDGLSPLLFYTRQQTEAMAQELQAAAINVQFAMRYGNPSLPVLLQAMQKAGVQRLLIFPLFPQFSAATNATILDAVQAAYASSRCIPVLRFAQPFFSHSAFLDAWSRHIRDQADPKQFDRVLFSFHGLPQRHVDQGDPYAQQCQATAQALAERLALPPEQWQLTYQSRFGREPWLLPATDQRLQELPAEGVQRLLVICPGFVSDCLETLEEIGMRGRDSFLYAGGEYFQRVTCLNDAPIWLSALQQITREELAGWLPAE
ncbi:ferrochelatase [Candidatus Magnetaquicoccus inordinatus]|uniref:ferrochelatase n=1 Tax=Candidatus Magnetaquicoccus inordinatus TaxID=2496818 RepID=UPI00102B8D1C|nr:ferrochelatase [Candidatus Magnetaquicoccus inordinatus]